MNRTTLFFVTALFSSSPAFAGNITGTVSFGGKAPAAAAIDMSSDPKCKAMSKGAKTNDFLVNGGKVQNVFVYVKNAPKKKYKAKGIAKMDQKGCRYIPKVLGVMVKQKIEIKNSDPTLHNVHAFAKRGEFNQAMPVQNQKITKKFKKAQVMVPVKCDVHPWMQAYVGVMAHPFFGVTNEGGKFSFDAGDLPDGEYELSFWHEKLGEKTAKVKVAGGAGAADFSY